MTEPCPLNGKVRYRTEGDAQRGARVIQRRGSPDAHPYHCPACHSWHVGTGRHLEPDKPKTFQRPQREVPPTAPGTVHCQRAGCGHPEHLHAVSACLGGRGRCTCVGIEVAS